MTAALEGGEWSAARPGRTLAPKKTQYQFYRRLGGPQGRSGLGGNSRPHRYSIPDRPVRSHSLCRLSYRVHSGSMKCEEFLDLDLLLGIMPHVQGFINISVLRTSHVSACRLIFAALVTNFLTIYESRNFATVLTRILHSSLLPSQVPSLFLTFWRRNYFFFNFSTFCI